MSLSLGRLFAVCRCTIGDYLGQFVAIKAWFSNSIIFISPFHGTARQTCLMHAVACTVDLYLNSHDTHPYRNKTQRQ